MFYGSIIAANTLCQQSILDVEVFIRFLWKFKILILKLAIEAAEKINCFLEIPYFTSRVCKKNSPRYCYDVQKGYRFYNYDAKSRHHSKNYTTHDIHGKQHN